MRISDCSSDVCSSDLQAAVRPRGAQPRIRLALENRDLPALFGEAVGCRDADNTATDDDGTPASAFSGDALPAHDTVWLRSEEHTSELQSLMRISYAVFCLKKKKQQHATTKHIR